jgi:hypothetical protein
MNTGGKMSPICSLTRLVFSVRLSRIVLIILVACTSASAVTPPVEKPTPLLLSAIFSPLASLLLSPGILLPVKSAQTETMYSFEDIYSGWTPQTYYDTMACVKVSHSTDEAKDGQFSLKLDMDLVGNDGKNSRGEAWVDMRYFPPSALEMPFKSLDLNNRTITMWVYAPTGTTGDINRPNGLQIFVKDIHWNGSYSTWTNVVEDEWVQLTFTVSNTGVENGYIEPGFDPSQIIAVGVKMAAGGRSTAVYPGPIYVDAVSW